MSKVQAHIVEGSQIEAIPNEQCLVICQVLKHMHSILIKYCVKSHPYPDFDAWVDVIEWIRKRCAMSRNSWTVFDSGLW